MNILLDYFFKITSIVPTSAASTAFLRQVLVVVSPKSGVTAGSITLCTNTSEVSALTDNTEVNQLFDGGMSRIYVLVADDLDMATLMDTYGNDFYTILISSDFTDADFGSLDTGVFDGVVGVSSTDEAFLKTQAAVEKQSAWFTKSANGAKNMMFGFGKLLSATSWKNQQYISMPENDEVITLGKANLYFDDKISFVMNDVQYGKRLGLFVAGGKAIVAPYIEKNLKLDLQGEALSYISGNQPQYTLTEATLLEDELQKVIDDKYIATALINAGVVSISLINDNFTANGNINISEPSAFWRIEGELKQTL